jgi:hypothetical protein
MGKRPGYRDPRIIYPVTDLPEGNRKCGCCGKPLKRRCGMLELDQRTDTFHDFGGVPAEKSQGWFPFGIDCGRRLIAEAQPKVLGQRTVA